MKKPELKTLDEQVVKILYEPAIEADLLMEAIVDSDKKRIYLEGIFLQSNIVNRNGRIYNKSWFKAHVDRYIQEKINNLDAYGELMHPDYFEVNPKTQTHRIISLREDGDNWIGKLVILDNPLNPDIGQIKAIIHEGTKLGVSSRAAGRTITKKGIQEVQEAGFAFSTVADIVTNPSAPEAYVNAIMEKKEFIWGDGGTLVEARFDKVVQTINKAYQNGNVKQEAFEQMMKNIINNLNGN